MEGEAALAARGVAICCATCGATFYVERIREHSAKYCSLHCRDSWRRVSKPCQVCGIEMSLKRSEADRRLFCSRKCMQAAWACTYCAKLRPEERRGDPFCSERCALGAELEAEFEATGNLRAVCGKCQRILPSDAFHKGKENRNGLSGRCKDCQREQYTRNKDAYRLRRFKYDAIGGKVIPFTPEQKAARFSMWGGRCWKCGIADATSEDHIKPISRGGWHCLSNLRPACFSCNAAKSGRWPLEGEWCRANFQHPNPRPGSDAELQTPRLPRTQHTCPQCGTTKEVTASWARNHTYCGRDCAKAARAQQFVDLTCGGCGKTFTVPLHSVRRRFCSYECAVPHRRLGGRRRAQPGTGQGSLF